jgi:hypothetical protein
MCSSRDAFCSAIEGWSCPASVEDAVTAGGNLIRVGCGEVQIRYLTMLDGFALSFELESGALRGGNFWHGDIGDSPDCRYEVNYYFGSFGECADATECLWSDPAGLAPCLELLGGAGGAGGATG